tara:strand:+ start:950 stop:1216 length:267 start_codon:yes stop_codon:yes gene_type:complete
MSQLNIIYKKKFEKEQLDTHVDELQTLIEQLKQKNLQRSEFVRNNNHRLQYDEVKRQYISIYVTQGRFELLFKIIEAQQKMINSLIVR